MSGRQRRRHDARALGETPAAARLSDLRNELTALQTTYSDKYPDVIQMKEQIRLLERRVAQEEKKARGGRRGLARRPAARRRDRGRAATSAWPSRTPTC